METNQSANHPTGTERYFHCACGRMLSGYSIGYHMKSKRHLEIMKYKKDILELQKSNLELQKIKNNLEKELLENRK